MPSPRRPALRALAERAGILPDFEAGGRRHATSDAARVALLAAAGIDAGSEVAARRALAELEADEAGRLLEPVCVARAGGAPRPRVRGAAGARLAWRVVEEGGAEHEGEGTRLRLPPLPAGLHRLTLRARGPGGARESQQTLVLAPRGCVTPRERLGRRRVFGLWANLYTLRGPRGVGVGNLSDLGELARFAGRSGAAFVGVNPLHAVRNRPPEVSPYGPVSRLFRNPLYLDLERVPELPDASEAKALLASDASRRELAALRAAGRIDWERAAALHRRVLAALHRAFARREAGRTSARGRKLADFRRRGGDRLEDFATFCALEDHLAARGHPRDWRAWPARYRAPDGSAVRTFRDQNREAVDLHVFAQFETAEQLARAAAAGRRAGLAIGLYQDLALGSLASGFDTWAFPSLFVTGASVGAPPDAYAPEGQDWGFPPLHPGRLRARGHDYWVALLRAAFEHAGALRIDHAMALARLWWVPPGGPAPAGAYVRYPRDELLAILALESRRAGALVIGEDLGTVPAGFSSQLARHGVLSSRVFLFERERSGAFRAAARYSRRALVTANTHDLPSLPAWWEGRDLEIDRRLGRLPDDAALARGRAERERDRRAVLRRLRAEDVLPGGRAPASSPALCAAVHSFLCRTPAPLVGISLDDLAGETEPVNVPGLPFDRYPSWTRRMRMPLSSLPRDPGVRVGLAGARSRGAKARP